MKKVEIKSLSEELYLKDILRKERDKERKKLYYLDNRDRIRERRKKRRLDNYEHFRKIEKLYYLDNKELFKLCQDKRRKKIKDNSKCVVYAYKFKNTDNIVYIGSTNCLYFRKALRTKNTISNLFDAIYYRYPNIFELVVLFEHEDILVIRELELLLIHLFNPIFNVGFKNKELSYLSKLIGSLILWNYSILNNEELVCPKSRKLPLFDKDVFNEVDFNNLYLVHLILSSMILDYNFKLDEMMYKK